MAAVSPFLPRHPEAIAIGGSAGGLEALGVLLRGLPTEMEAAVLVCVHLSDRHPSLLPDALAMRCALPVVEAQDKEPILAGHLYVAIPRYHFQVAPDRSCSLSQDEPVCFSRPSIDVLFETAAWVYGERLLGILLSGASADGAHGLKTIRDCGGTTWVQQPDTASAPTMPLAAIARGAADFILTPNAMAHHLQSHFGALPP